MRFWGPFFVPKYPTLGNPKTSLSGRLKTSQDVSWVHPTRYPSPGPLPDLSRPSPGPLYKKYNFTKCEAHVGLTFCKAHTWLPTPPVLTRVPTPPVLAHP